TRERLRGRPQDVDPSKEKDDTPGGPVCSPIAVGSSSAMACLSITTPARTNCSAALAWRRPGCLRGGEGRGRRRSWTALTVWNPGGSNRRNGIQGRRICYVLEASGTRSRGRGKSSRASPRQLFSSTAHDTGMSCCPAARRRAPNAGHQPALQDIRALPEGARDEGSL
ncbi:unnamed protein product, partial [Scytosiphon promiscuus]